MNTYPPDVQHALAEAREKLQALQDSGSWDRIDDCTRCAAAWGVDDGPTDGRLCWQCTADVMGTGITVQVRAA